MNTGAVKRWGGTMGAAGVLAFGLVAPGAWAQDFDQAADESDYFEEQSPSEGSLPGPYALPTEVQAELAGQEPAFAESLEDDLSASVELAERPPVRGAGGGYCYTGPHPTDPARSAGSGWHDHNGPHTHFYPPIDMRLFTIDGQCHTFVGDPVDFGAQDSNVYGFYGAHPLAFGAPSAWCFMIGGHHHGWAPRSTFYMQMGPFSYWRGGYDQTFWNNWRYYAHFYQQQYPHYYQRGAFIKNHGAQRAPGIAPQQLRRPRVTTLRGSQGHVPLQRTNATPAAMPAPAQTVPQPNRRLVSPGLPYYTRVHAAPAPRAGHAPQPSGTAQPPQTPPPTPGRAHGQGTTGRVGGTAQRTDAPQGRTGRLRVTRP